MARQRLTRETLASVNELAGAREHIRLAESILGRSATDNEILATAHRLSHLDPAQVRAINKDRQEILRQNKRIAAAPDGSEDPWDESGPNQPDPTNNQAYTKQIMTTPDHAVLDSLQRKDKHAPTAGRRARDLSRATRERYRLAAGEEDEEEVPDIEDDFEGDDEFGDEDLLDEAGEEGEDAGDVLDEEMEDAELGDEELEGDEEEALDLDEDRGDLDDMLDMEDAELDEEDLGEPDIFDDVDIDEEAGIQGEVPAAPMANRQRRPASRQASRQAGRGRRVIPGGQQPRNRQLRTGADGGSGPARMSLDEILDVHDDDIERTASTPMEGDDLEALLGARVERATGRRVATTKRPERESPAAQQRRAMLENVWDTENEPEIMQMHGGRRPVQRQAAAPQQQQPRRRQAARRGRPVQQQQNYAPDRRRPSPSRSADNEFDQVFGVDGMPDVSKFFD